MLSKSVLIVLLLLKVLSSIEASGNDICAEILPEFEKVSISENLPGKWTSKGCESRVGAKFVLRSYEFFPNYSFSLNLHHYEDEWCSSPLYSISAEGYIDSGAFSVSSVKVVPHSTAIARELQEKVNNTCPGSVTRNWRPNREYFLYGGKKVKAHTSKKSQKTDCSHALAIDFSELLVIKMQKSEQNLELLLGAVGSSDSAQLALGYQVPMIKTFDNTDRTTDGEASFDKPIEFHTKLPGSIFLGSFQPRVSSDLLQDESSKFLVQMREKMESNSQNYTKLTTNCVVCESIAKASMMSPPYLSRRALLPVYLTGSWQSTSCESQPTGGFLLRNFHFNEYKRKFFAKFRYFDDAFCTMETYTILINGEYFLSFKNKLLQGATDVDYYIKSTKITVHDFMLLEQFNKLLHFKNSKFIKRDELALQVMLTQNYCNVGEFKLNKPKLIRDQYCPIYGVDLKDFEKNILKLEVDIYGTTLLSMGSKEVHFEGNPSSFKNHKYRGYNLNDFEERPTSYGLPLAQCDDNVENLQFNQQFMNSSSSISIQNISVLVLLAYLLKNLI